MQCVVCIVQYAPYTTTCGNGAVTGWGQGQIKICLVGMGIKLLQQELGEDYVSPRVTLY
jgi:hypothetical protein